MRKKLQVLFLGSILTLNAQTTNLTPSPTDSELNFIDINPPSPESFYRTSFGNTPLNEYKGMQNLSIPLFQIEFGKISFPIALNYTKLGVEIDDISNDVGVSWVLETGGVINRTINGSNDELYTFGSNSGNRKYFTDADIARLSVVEDGTDEAGELFRYMNFGIDTEVDIFNFVLPGASGSFFLDKDLKPVLLNNKNQCRIDSFYQNSQYQFIVTTNNGYKYYFGGTNGSEITKNKIGDKQGVTSYYLIRIEDVSGHSVYFEYNELPVKTITETISQKQLMISYYDSDLGCNGPSLETFESKNVNKTITPKTLKRIYFDDKEYIFDRTEVGKNGISKLNSIKLNKNNTLMSEFRFSYIDNTANNVIQRFFLQKIEEFAYTEGSVKKQEYEFDYYTPQLPNRLSFDKDYLGYYNGKSNSNLIPDTEKLGNVMTFLGQVPLKGSADRTPNFIDAVKGSLKSITYPTKGKSFFEYEPNKARQIKTSMQDMMVSNEELSPAVYSRSIIIPKDSIIGNKLRIGYFLSTTSTNITPGHRSIVVKILDANTNVIKSSRTFSLGHENTIESNSYDFTIEPNIDYKIILNLDEQCDSGTAELNVNYDNRYVITDYAGIRLKKSYDISDNNITNIKRIYYSKLIDINNVNSLGENTSPYFYTTSVFGAYICNGSGFPLGEANMIAIYLNSSPRQFNLILGTSSNLLFPNQQFYHNVTVSYGGDDFEKGGEEKEFSFQENSGFGTLIEPTSGAYLANYLSQLSDKVEYFGNSGGNLLKLKVFSKRNNNYYLQKLEKNEYELKEYSRIFNIVGVKAYSIPYYTTDPNKTISNYLIGYYSATCFGNFLLKSSSTDYRDDVPLDTEDDSSYNKLTTTTEYFYNNPSHYQLTSQKTTFPDSSYQTTDYKYAAEKPSTYLTGKNMIGIPLITETTKTTNGVTKTISKTETNYPIDQQDADNNTSGLPLAKSVSVLDVLTGVSSTEVTYNQYDSKGNLLQYTAKSGIPTAIIWGYNNTQPIAKIEGAAYSQVSGYISNIVSKSDTDNTTGTATSEQDLVDALDLFRKTTQLSGFQITTYTYDPLIGVKTITPPSGVRQVYIYDTANRLKEVREQNQTGNLLKEYQYHYKN